MCLLQNYNNMKQLLTKSAFSIVVLILLIGAGQVSAVGWIDPPATPLTANVDTLLNVDSFDQVKKGNLSVGAFLANQPSAIFGKTFFSGVVRGNTIPTVATLNDVVLSGNVGATSFIQSDTLAKGGNNKPLCVDNNGVIYVCAVPVGTVVVVDLCPNIAGDQSVIPLGLAQADSGDCLTAPTVTNVAIAPTYKTVQVQKSTSTVVSGRSVTLTLSAPLISSTTFYYQATIRGSEYKGGWGSSYGVVNIPLVGTAGQSTVSGNLAFPNGKNIVLSNCIGRELPTVSPDNKATLPASYQKNTCDPTAPIGGGTAGIGCDPANPTVPPSSFAPWWQCVQ